MQKLKVLSQSSYLWRPTMGTAEMHSYLLSEGLATLFLKLRKSVVSHAQTTSRTDRRSCGPPIWPAHTCPAQTATRQQVASSFAVRQERKGPYPRAQSQVRSKQRLPRHALMFASLLLRIVPVEVTASAREPLVGPQHTVSPAVVPSSDVGAENIIHRPRIRIRTTLGANMVRQEHFQLGEDM
mgnify:CR=1 FL=1